MPVLSRACFLEYCALFFRSSLDQFVCFSVILQLIVTYLHPRSGVALLCVSPNALIILFSLDVTG